MCRILSVSSAGYYRWRGQQVGPRKQTEGLLTLRIRAIYEASQGRYGCPRIHAALRNEEVYTSRKRVARIMQEHGLVGRSSRKFVKTTHRDETMPAASNLLARDFSASGVNQKWAGDITYLATDEGWVYLAVLLDLFSRRVVGWALADHLKTELALEALNMAIIERRPLRGLMHHTDRGCQYTSASYRQRLRDNGFECSMSRKGECWDNSVSEAFFGRLKEEAIHGRKFKTRAEVIRVVNEYIQYFYNAKRIQKRIGYLCPIEYELILAAKFVA